MAIEADEAKVLGEGLVHLNAHEPSPFPCLCGQCIQGSARDVDVLGMRLHREHAVAKGRVLFYWLPHELLGESAEVRRAVEARMHDALEIRR